MSATQESPVLFRMVSDHVALITLNRPTVGNAINGEATRLLGGIVARVEADVSIRAAVLTGAGEKVFCAGGDLAVISAGNIGELTLPESGFAGFVNAKRLTPWIAAVEGAALAGGCQIALACDMIVASETAAFGLPEVMRGLVAWAGGLYRLPRAIPPAIAIEMILTGDRLSAGRAAAFGMVNRLEAPGQVVAAAVRLAERIAGNAPLAVAESLRIAKFATDAGDADLARSSEAARDRLQASEDFKEGPLAFMEKRPPVWKGL